MADRRFMPPWLSKASAPKPQGNWRGNWRGRGGFRGRGRGAPPVQTVAQSTNWSSAGQNKVKIFVAANDELGAKFRYDAKFVDAMRRVPGARWAPEEMAWKFPESAHDRVVQEVALAAGAPASSCVEALPRDVLALVKSKVAKRGMGGMSGGGNASFAQKNATPTKSDVRKIVEEKLPEWLLGRLKGYQLEGVEMAIHKNGRALFGDEMGLGKTVQALTVALYYRQDWPLLIVCPSSLRLTWAAELQSWLRIESDDIQVIYKSKETPESDICIISYDLMSKMSPEVLSRYHFIIADESHYLKSRDAKRTKAVCPLVQNARRALLLTGTPALSRPIELFTQLNALDSNKFRSVSSFGARYCDGHKTAFGWDYTGSSNLPELHLLLAETVMIRRLKADVLHELPAKRRQCIFVECSKAAAKDLEQLRNKCTLLEQQIKEAGLESAQKQELEFKKRNVLMEMYTKTGEGKLPAVVEYIGDLIENQECKFLVFGHHHTVLDGIASRLDKAGLRYIRIDGNTKQTLRQPLCDDFQTNEDCRVALLSITAAGLGLTLHAGTLVVFAELFWNPSALLQAEDRAHRVGQLQCVDIKYILSRNTLDDMQWPLIHRKLEVIGQSIDGRSANQTVTLDDRDYQSKSSNAKKQADDWLSTQDLDALATIDSDAAPWTSSQGMTHTPSRTTNQNAPTTPSSQSSAAKSPEMHSTMEGGEDADEYGGDTEEEEERGGRREEEEEYVAETDEEWMPPGSGKRKRQQKESPPQRKKQAVAGENEGDDVVGESADHLEMRQCPICNFSAQWYLIEKHVEECMGDMD